MIFARECERRIRFGIEDIARSERDFLPAVVFVNLRLYLLAAHFLNRVDVREQAERLDFFTVARCRQKTVHIAFWSDAHMLQTERVQF